MVLRAYKYRIYPNKEQKEFINKNFNANRFMYNYCLGRIEDAYKQGVKISVYDISKEITMLKKTDDKFKWLNDIDARSLEYTKTNLKRAYTNYFRHNAEKPVFKSKYKSEKTYITDGIKIDFDNNLLHLPKCKNIKCKYHRIFDGKTKMTTIRIKPSGKYYVSILVDDGLNMPNKKPICENTSVGIDLGLKTYAVLSNGDKINKTYDSTKLKQRKKILQARLAKKQKGSKNRNKYRQKIAKIDEKITNIRNNFLNNITSDLANANNIDTFCLETLDVKGMVSKEENKDVNANLRKNMNNSIHDTSWSIFNRMLEYKCDQAGKNIIRIDQYEATTKTCTCGYKNDDLTLGDRSWVCPICGLKHDRDLLASKNILKIAMNQQDKTSRPKRTSLKEKILNT